MTTLAGEARAAGHQRGANPRSSLIKHVETQCPPVVAIRYLRFGQLTLNVKRIRTKAAGPRQTWAAADVAVASRASGSVRDLDGARCCVRRIGWETSQMPHGSAESSGPGRADAAAVATTVIETAPWPLSLKAWADTIVEGSVRLISALRAEPLSFDLIVRTHRGSPRARPRLGSVVHFHSRDVAASAGTSARAQSGPGAPDRRRGLRLAGDGPPAVLVGRAMTLSRAHTTPNAKPAVSTDGPEP
jgi:hypothetical protein